ncbi:recombination protein RecT [Azospirillum sp.]|uniref:recombination protein RecT n=1 Tax=Azospirillum sp. TaxID=34012 RepID=UPI002D24B3F6|nr:recombination protein RecT [Azospirillum sp.]HYF89015.1 recombination protein RecT [Azospirillum sp.]
MTTTNTAAAPGRSLAELRQAGRQVAKQAGGSTVAAFFDANKETLKALLPAHMTPDRMMKIALGALRTTPKLMDCTIESLFGAVVVCAQMGLEPNTPQGHIYLIPFENRRKGATEVQIIVGYKGLIDLARRSGQIESLSARVVHERDAFDIDYGTADSITHKPFLAGDRGKITGFYAVAKLKGGGVQFEFMSVAEVNAVRDGSQGYQTAKRFNKSNTPWMTNYEEMGKKTVIRRLAKYLPMSIEMANAVVLDGRAEAGETQGLDRVLDGDFTVVGSDEVAPEQEPQAEQAETPHDPETGEVVEVQQAATQTDSLPAETTDWPAKVAELKAGANACADVQAFVAFKKANKATIDAMPDDVHADWCDFAEARAGELRGPK